jgi:hypothetical protein
VTPAWLGRLLAWALRRRRMVRVHLKGDAPSISGFYRGRWDGHYVLDVAKLHVSTTQTELLEGRVSIPVGNVLFVQDVVAVES